ncbi:MAG TPA: VanZ family protein [Tepidisphaeraceae bacterium]|jgi:VanZ family protein
MKRSSRSLFLLLLVYWLTIFVLTHTPAEDLPRVEINDKLEHFLAYGLLGGLLYLCFWSISPPRRDMSWIVLLIGMSYGALDEIIQMIPILHRSAEIADWMADTTGLAIAVGCMGALRAYSVRRKWAVGLIDAAGEEMRPPGTRQRRNSFWKIV